MVGNRSRNSSETNAIQNRMEEVRRDLDEDVQDTVEGVRDLGDWRSYVKAYPWCFVGAAFATGSLMTRRLRLQSQPVVESNDERGDPSHPLDVPTLPTKSITRDFVLPFVGNLIAQGVSSYVAEVAGRLAAKHTKIIPDDQLHS